MITKTLAELTKDLAAANAIIEKLPLTADKVRVVLGMELWLPMDCKYPGEVDGILNDGLLLMNECVDWPDRAGAEEPTYKSTWLYSTPEAAREAADA